MHGEAKTQLGLRHAVHRGLSNVAIQAYLTAAVINLKRLVASVGMFFLQFRFYFGKQLAQRRLEFAIRVLATDFERNFVWRKAV